MRSDLNMGFSYLFVSAQGGVPLAQYDVATMYLDGVGTEQSYEKAAKYFTMAAD